jgi:hypothetical protein
MSKPETTEPSDLAGYKDVSTAPFVYFDKIAAHGFMNEAIQIELASRILIPLTDGGVEVRYDTSGRLRCSPAAARYLRDAINSALRMLEEPQQPTPVASCHLN